jgi:hypothetical protein
MKAQQDWIAGKVLMQGVRAGASLRRLRGEGQWLESTFELILLAVLSLVAISQDETDVRYLRNTMVKKRYGSGMVQAGRGRVHNCSGYR